MRWYLSQNGKTSGPFDEQRLAMLAHWGKISRNAFICDAQLSAWIAIRRSAFAPLLPPAEPRTRASLLSNVRAFAGRARAVIAARAGGTALGLLAFSALLGALLAL